MAVFLYLAHFVLFGWLTVRLFLRKRINDRLTRAEEPVAFWLAVMICMFASLGGLYLAFERLEAFA